MSLLGGKADMLPVGIGNLPPRPGAFPNYPAPVIRNTGGDREMVMMRWGMPSPPKVGGPSVSNIYVTGVTLFHRYARVTPHRYGRYV